MKKICLLAAAAMIFSFSACSKSNDSAPAADNPSAAAAPESAAPADAKAAPAKKSDINIGDQFAFAGLSSDLLVPDFAVEISELQKSEKGDNPVKDSVYFYTGTNKDVISVDQLNAYMSKLQDGIKKIADDGKIYKGGAFGDTKLGDEILEFKPFDKSFGDYSCLYKYKDKWFKINASHKVQHKSFTKQYPEKYFGVAIAVQAWIVE